MILKMLVFFSASTFAAWILLFAGISTRRESRRRSDEEHTRTTGVIVDYARGEHHAGKGGALIYWKPVVEFTAEGQAYRLEYPNHMNRERYPVGETVDILYNVSDPTRFHLAMDPVFTDPGGGAIRIAVVWIVIGAALTIALAVFVGGADLGFSHLWREIKWLFSRRRVG